ncbi:MAG: transporter substrate-binding domain-containing protein [Desulfovibrio sp.]|nr:transporter substrate-binding domain-containing protein [Desulfovibrio sp.]
MASEPEKSTPIQPATELTLSASNKARKKYESLFIALAAALIVAVCIYLVYFYINNHREPKVRIQPKNCFAETLTVVTDIDYNPFSYVNADGDYAGFDVELINEVANRLGMNLDLKLMEWGAAQKAIFGQEAQIIMNMETDYVAQDQSLISTLPTVEKQYVIYGREIVSSVAQLYGRKVASMHALPALGLGREITYLPSYADIFDGLKNGRFDFVVCPIQVGNYFLEKLKLSDVRPSYAVSHVYGAMVLLENNRELRDRINPILRDLWREGFFAYLTEKWVHHYYVNTTFKDYITRHPWIWPSAFLIILTAALGIMYIRSKRREITAREEYARQAKYIETIEFQRQKLIEANRASEQRTLEISKALISILGARDPNLNGHSQHVQNLTLLLYEHLPESMRKGLNRSDLSYAALFHDVGKMGIPESILNKPSKLDDDEWAVMKKHPRISTEILSTVSSFKSIEKWVLYHHERIDGHGYFSVPGETIPFAAKMIAVADTYSAITMRRSYKDPKSHEQAVAVLQEIKGKQLDSELVDIFCSIDLSELLACAPANLEILP